MTEATQPTTLNFNGAEYPVDSLSERAKYLVSQIQDLQAQGTATRAKLDQIDIASKGFSDLLEMELEPETEEVLTEE